MSKKFELKDLSVAERKKLLQELKEQEADAARQTQAKRKQYKQTVNEIIPGLFKDLQEASKLLSLVKSRVYKGVESLVTMKSDVYGKQVDQTSHSFSTDSGETIIIGYRHLDGWDDTAEVGIAKVHEFIKSMGKDANSKALVKTVLQLLSKDKSGMLKASRVLQLKKMAEETGNAEFIDAINIIQEAYRPTRTKEFLTCRYKDEKGNQVDLPLNITDAEILK